MFNELKTQIKELKEIQEQNNIWKGSSFEEINDLKIDYSGKVGENSLYEFLKSNTNYDIEFNFDSNVNAEDGTYDLKVNNKRLEIKTARLGNPPITKSKKKRKSNTGTFQHENLHNGVCDFTIFIDITPKEYFITFLDLRNFNLSEKHEVFKTKAHLRKNSDNRFKFDTSFTSLSRGISGGLTMRCDHETHKSEILNFIDKFLNNSD